MSRPKPRHRRPRRLRRPLILLSAVAGLVLVPSLALAQQGGGWPTSQGTPTGTAVPTDAPTPTDGDSSTAPAPPADAATPTDSPAPPADSNNGTYSGDTGQQQDNGQPQGGSLAQLTGNPDCTLRVPANPLSAKGLATPYVLHSAGAQCSEDQATGAFVQALIFDPATGLVAAYDPEVITPGETAPVPPVPPLRHGDIVAVWTGFNGNQLKLTGPGAHEFVNFAQQSYDNSPQMFTALRTAVRRHQLTVPPLGNDTVDGTPCPTTRSFAVVDQDPNDNVPVTYTYGTQASNGSDEQLLDLVLGAIGCQQWTVPLLDPSVAVGNGHGQTTSGILQELQAGLDAVSPVASVPGNDEFTTSDGNFVQSVMNPDGDGVFSLYLSNLYRSQVGQKPVTHNNTMAFCEDLAGSTGAGRLAADYAADAAQPAPAFAPIGNNLALVLGARFQATWGNLNCDGLLGMQSPIQVETDGNDIAVSETYNGEPLG